MSEKTAQNTSEKLNYKMALRPLLVTLWDLYSLLRWLWDPYFYGPMYWRHLHNETLRISVRSLGAVTSTESPFCRKRPDVVNLVMRVHFGRSWGVFGAPRMVDTVSPQRVNLGPALRLYNVNSISEDFSWGHWFPEPNRNRVFASSLEPHFEVFEVASSTFAIKLWNLSPLSCWVVP